MTTLENYIKENGLSSDSGVEKITLLFNAAIPVAKKFQENGYQENAHKNESVMLLAASAVDDIKGKDNKLADCFNYRFVTETLTDLLIEEIGGIHHIWG